MKFVSYKFFCGPFFLVLLFLVTIGPIEVTSSSDSLIDNEKQSCYEFNLIKCNSLQKNEQLHFGTMIESVDQLTIIYIQAYQISSNIGDAKRILGNQISQTTSLLDVVDAVFSSIDLIGSVNIVIGTIYLEKNSAKGDKRNNTRNYILIKEVISENPGVHLRSIQRITGLSMGVIQYYLHSLEKIPEVESLKLGRNKHFFVLSYKFTDEEKVFRSLMQNENIKNILLIVSSFEDHGCTQKQISELLGISKALTSYYIKNLQKYGVIEKIHLRQIIISPIFDEILYD